MHGVANPARERAMAIGFLLVGEGLMCSASFIPNRMGISIYTMVRSQPLFALQALLGMILAAALSLWIRRRTVKTGRWHTDFSTILIALFPIQFVVANSALITQVGLGWLEALLPLCWVFVIASYAGLLALLTARRVSWPSSTEHE